VTNEETHAGYGCFISEYRQSLSGGCERTNMDPITHVALAYLLYVGYMMGRAIISKPTQTHHLPATWAFIPLAIGSQFPDLIDKPLAYWGVLVSGRSLAHSAFSLLLIGVLLDSVTRIQLRDIASRLPTRLRASIPTAFVIGYAGHLLGDAAYGLFSGEFFSVRFLVYPVSALSRSAGDEVAPWVRVINLYDDPSSVIHVEIVTAALIVFIGLRVWKYSRRRVHKLN
jgi:hypothetical protein